MQHYEKKTVTETKTVYKYTECDICDAQTSDERNWNGGQFSVNEVKIECTIGTSYPGSGNVDISSVDICPDCFTQKLVPFLESLGAKIHKRNVDY